MFKMKDIVYVHEYPEIEGQRCQIVGVGKGEKAGTFLLVPIDGGGTPILEDDALVLYSVPEERVSLSPMEL